MCTASIRTRVNCSHSRGGVDVRIRAMGKTEGNLLSLIRYLTEKGGLDGPAVLVVDDEPLIRMNIAATFEDAGRRNLWFAPEVPH